MRGVQLTWASALALSVLLLGCDPKGGFKSPPPVTADNHTWFPLTAGTNHEYGKQTSTGAIECASCHPPAGDSFKDFSCTACHEHDASFTNRLHLTLASYTYEPQSCYSCHPDGATRAFGHSGIVDACAECHQEGGPFAALPIPNFTHPATNGADCGLCHVTSSWKEVSGGPTTLASNPADDVTVVAQVPTWSGLDIASVSPLTQVLPMKMNHASMEVDPTAMASCASCHLSASAGNFFPGTLHSALANLTVAQPTACGSCHGDALPKGFVGPVATNPARTPPSPEMRHDAVAWASGAPTTLALVPTDCGVCHLAPGSQPGITWAAGRAGTSPALYHAGLAAAGKPQPGSCIDCHANTRPGRVLTSMDAALPAGLAFDHASPAARGDCTTCHAKSATPPFASWTQGAFHVPGSTTPATCLPCHAGERPTSATGWTNPTYGRAPFDYGTNVNGVTHGAGLDCVTCHANPGSGQWGMGHNWAGGNFMHTATSLAGTTCLSCHTTQRPDLVLGAAAANTALNFDHATNGTGDCFACHQATVAANRYANYFNPATSALPGGDWKDGVPYPGSTYAASATHAVTVTQLHLNRSGANNLVTSMSSTQATLYNGMLHTSAQVPAALNAGPTGMPDNAKCWHCHTATGTTVTSFSDGVFHDALTNYRATPGGTLAPFPQPTTGCSDCHANGRPLDIVQKMGGALLSMDHASEFAAPAMLGGRTVSRVDEVDCSVCHKDPGGNWSDGVFHANLGAAQPKECVSCHYPLMAQPASDVTAATNAMKHRSAQLQAQACEACHAMALTKSTTQPATAALWSPGVFHANVTAQPTACVDCHAASRPASNMPTQSTVTWPFTLGGTATNGGMWMNHGASNVVGRDCAVCHQADAKPTGSAWSKATAFHQPTPSATACATCHGLANGNGAAPGTRNNLPHGLTNSHVTTSASAATGVAGQLVQLTHGDLNIGTRDCAFCHSDPGGSWSTAKLHLSFNAANPLTLNGTTARCSNCHLNVKPGPGYSTDHSTFSDAPGTQDCSACHAWPGTGTSMSPNWLGATGSPLFIAVGGFTVSSPPAPAGTTQPGIMSLPHPSMSAGDCTTCHDSSGGGKNAKGYDHASALISANCGACHEAGSNLVKTAWNGATTTATGAGDTRPFSLTSLVATFGNGMTVTAANHFYPADCSQCHVTPAGVAATTTGAAYAAAWDFPHDQARMANPSTCLLCHTTGVPGPPDGGVADPTLDVSITGLVPLFSGTRIASVTPLAQTLPMTMVHASTEVPAAANSACSNCHPTAASGFYYPATLHSSLANLALAQPTACGSCHGSAAPQGFVGPTATSPARTPASGEMRHEAVRWNAGAPTTTKLVSTNCAQCHASPSATLAATWATGPDGGALRYHAAIGTQPTSCLDCHANSRPEANLTSMNAMLPANVAFDHRVAPALDDCAGCHAASTQAPWASWTGGRYHLAGAGNPTTCLPCHAAERPTSTTGWASPTYTQSPFDYGTNAAGVTHGAGQDCALCHVGPGTGAWGSTQNWQAGHFTHGPGTPSASTCLACHSTQRPDLVLGASQAAAALSGFDHATSGTGDCLGCHMATVVANTYTRYFNQATGMLPNGDWKGGVSYPGSTLVAAPTQFVDVTEWRLTRSGTFVTGMTSSTARLTNAMLHTSAALPTELNAGPTGSPDNTKCWHCHTHSGTTVTSFVNGQYHASLTTYSATPGGTVTPFPQPTTGCNDCHDAMTPHDIVEKSASTLQPMDHAAQFVTAVNLGGQSVTAVDQADCSVCHKAPGTTWGDGLFHANIGAATPKDCVQCHYPLMADTAKSDVTSGTTYAMKHGSPTLTAQACERCHGMALSQAAGASHAVTLWRTGSLHGGVTTQPTACTDCHAGSKPAMATQSTVTYTLPLGGTTSNGAQWMSHADGTVAGRDCAVCHQADAKPTGSAWSRSDVYHPNAPTVTGCASCHGTSNGRGTVIGTNNNLPNGLTNSTTTSSVAGVANTGVPAGTKAQLTHADVNVTAFDCGTCHTQKGTSTTPGVQGKEWAQAGFHSHFTGATALVMNGTTGRCSNCHLNVKPGTAYPDWDHSAINGSSQDCSSCHSWPGTGTAAAPDWKGAAGVPTYISVGGFPISQPPATTATTQSGIANLPHPTVGTGVMCTACHQTASGGKHATGYDHASTLITTKCTACHEAGSDLVGTPWNGATSTPGAGDTRPFTLTTATASFSGNTCRNFPVVKHFFPVNCRECHTAPTGLVNTSTGTTYTTRWKFVHTERNMTNPGTCNLCHAAPANCRKG